MPTRLAMIVSKHLALALALAWSRTAGALQPLQEFLAAAPDRDFDRREAAVAVEQRRQRLVKARLDLSPTLAVSAAYTRNQYQANVTLPNGDPLNPKTLVITPYNQLDAQVSLTQPIVEVGAWLQVGAARAELLASEARLAAADQGTQRAVAQAYFQLIAAEAMLRAALATRERSAANLAVIDRQVEGGVATELDRRRGRVEVERAVTTIADADYGLVVARQRLVSLTGLAPDEGQAELQVALVEEAPLAAWTGEGLASVASVRAAEAEGPVARANYAAAKGALYPSLSASANQRFTNVTGFIGRYAIASASLNLSWRFGLAAIPQLRAQRSQAALAEIRADRARQAAHDQVHQSWHQVRAALIKARSARVEREAAALAVPLARARYEAGTGLFLEVTQAERDAFTADLSRIRADADLALARVALRLAAGRPLDDVGFTIAPAATRDPGPVEP